MRTRLSVSGREVKSYTFFKCFECGSPFFCGKEAEKHEERIHGDRSFKCDIGTCTLGFKNRRTLLNHKEEAHHFCEFCKKMFKSGRIFTAHRQSSCCLQSASVNGVQRKIKTENTLVETPLASKPKSALKTAAQRQPKLLKKIKMQPYISKFVTPKIEEGKKSPQFDNLGNEHREEAINEPVLVNETLETLQSVETNVHLTSSVQNESCLQNKSIKIEFELPEISQKPDLDVSNDQLSPWQRVRKKGQRRRTNRRCKKSKSQLKVELVDSANDQFENQKEPDVQPELKSQMEFEVQPEVQPDDSYEEQSDQHLSFKRTLEDLEESDQISLSTQITPVLLPVTKVLSPTNSCADQSTTCHKKSKRMKRTSPSIIFLKVCPKCNIMHFNKESFEKHMKKHLEEEEECSTLTSSNSTSAVSKDESSEELTQVNSEEMNEMIVEGAEEETVETFQSANFSGFSSSPETAIVDTQTLPNLPKLPEPENDDDEESPAYVMVDDEVYMISELLKTPVHFIETHTSATPLLVSKEKTSTSPKAITPPSSSESEFSKAEISTKTVSKLEEKSPSEVMISSTESVDNGQLPLSLPEANTFPPKKNFCCKNCQKAFHNKDVLLEHVKNEKCAVAMSIECRFCPAVFASEDGLLEHESAHVRVKLETEARVEAEKQERAKMNSNQIPTSPNPGNSSNILSHSFRSQTLSNFFTSTFGLAQNPQSNCSNLQKETFEQKKQALITNFFPKEHKTHNYHAREPIQKHQKLPPDSATFSSIYGNVETVQRPVAPRPARQN